MHEEAMKCITPGPKGKRETGVIPVRSRHCDRGVCSK